MDGRIEAIYTAPAEALPVIRRVQANAQLGVGLDGDRYSLATGFWSGDHKVSRDITLIEAEVIEALRFLLDSERIWRPDFFPSDC